MNSGSDKAFDEYWQSVVGSWDGNEVWHARDAEIERLTAERDKYAAALRRIQVEGGEMNELCSVGIAKVALERITVTLGD